MRPISYSCAAIPERPYLKSSVGWRQFLRLVHSECMELLSSGCGSCTRSASIVLLLKRAFDLDFRGVVLKDACFDADQEVHRVLTEKVFPVQAWVAATDEYSRHVNDGAVLFVQRVRIPS